MSALTFQLPDDLRVQVEELSKREGISIDEFLTTAATEMLRGLRSLELLKQAARDSKQEDWDYVMNRIPARPPLPGDELPEDLREALKRQLPSAS